MAGKRRVICQLKYIEQGFLVGSHAGTPDPRVMQSSMKMPCLRYPILYYRPFILFALRPPFYSFNVILPLLVMKLHLRKLSKFLLLTFQFVKLMLYHFIYDFFFLLILHILQSIFNYYIQFYWAREPLRVLPPYLKNVTFPVIFGVLTLYSKLQHACHQ